MSEENAVRLLRQQRLADMQLLQEIADSLPRGHKEKPGLIRAVEILKHEPI